MDTCDIHTCGGPRSYKVGKMDNVRTVCPRCMDELVNGFGWRLLGGVLSRRRPVSVPPDEVSAN